MSKKYVTLAEANAALPLVRDDLIALQKMMREMEQQYIVLQEKKAAYHKGATSSDEPDPFFALECELDFMQIEAKGLIRSISLKGGELKDVRMGLVDFPAIINGKEVLLCWRLGEDQITHYHGLHDGFLGRRPLES